MTEIYNDSFSLMGTNYHQKEALEIMKKLSKKNNYLTMSDEGIKEYILKTYSNVYEYKGTSNNTNRASRASNLSLIYSLFLVNFCL